jgi:hypothetical protein
MMPKLNRFVILDGEGPQEMFDRLMTMVGKIRGYGCDELDDHKFVKIMLEAYSPRNGTVVTLIRDKKFEYFTPNDVPRGILTFDMQREEANERKKLGELQAKLEGIKINKDVALKANKSSKQGSTSKSKINKQASTSKPKVTKQVQEIVETTSSSSESENGDDQYEKVDDVALFMKRYHKGLKKQGYKVVKRKFPNKKKRTCYNCGSTDHFIARCPYEIKDHKHKKERKEDKANQKRGKKNLGEAHIRHEWDSTVENSSEEDEEVATIAINKSSSPPRLFTNLPDDDYYSPHICLMAKGEKVKNKSKAKAPPPPSDISSSDLSDNSSDDESSDEEIDQITKNLDPKTKLFITKLMEDLESVQAELESREKTLIQ